MKQATEARRVLSLLLERSPAETRKARKATFRTLIERGENIERAAAAALDLTVDACLALAADEKEARRLAAAGRAADRRAAKAAIAARKNS